MILKWISQLNISPAGQLYRKPVVNSPKKDMARFEFVRHSNRSKVNVNPGVRLSIVRGTNLSLFIMRGTNRGTNNRKTQDGIYVKPIVSSPKKDMTRFAFIRHSNRSKVNPRALASVG
jgi:hypothetical protein